MREIDKLLRAVHGRHPNVALALAAIPFHNGFAAGQAARVLSWNPQ
jgi:hypothetical protein